MLLEFTATLPENAEVQQKYADKIITKFGLKEFLQKGYTKEINLVSGTLNKKERVLHALLFAFTSPSNRVEIRHCQFQACDVV